MAKYLQTCKCRGAGLSAVKDARRYEQEVHDIGLDIAKLERERSQARDRARLARLRIFNEPQGLCSVCSGTGIVESRGEIGGDRTELRAVDWKSANRIG